MKTLTLSIVSGALIMAQPSAFAAPYSLEFDVNHYTAVTKEVDGEPISYRAYENVVYVSNPVDTDYQSMNVYVPEAYFEGKSINGYTKESAPIFFPNAVGGYMPGKPTVAGESHFSRSPEGSRNKGQKIQDEHIQGKKTQESQFSSAGNPNAALVALSKGLVVAAPGARGRTNQDSNGNYVGKAPAAIVDLKAAVRYLHFNDAVMPGDANKIISNGTSAGGALSTLLGGSQDSQDYEPYLQALGAAKASDAVFAVSAYCPIIDLEHADMAYEWQFNGYNTYKAMSMRMLDFHVKRELVEGRLTAEQQKVSDLLKPLFPAYVNHLSLKSMDGKPLSLSANGEGSFLDYVVGKIQSSAQRALDNGRDLSTFSFISVSQGKVTQVDWNKYRDYALRQKLPPAFDALDLSAGENNLFGNKFIDNQHFTDFSETNSTDVASRVSDREVKLMNPMSYIDQPGSTIAPHWRIRVGTNDRDTSLAISALLALKLDNLGYDVDYSLPWDVPHSGDYDLDELFSWVSSITQ
jgi:hypothetical protein